MGAAANLIWLRVLAIFTNALATAGFPVDLTVCLPERRVEGFLDKLDKVNSPDFTLTVHRMPETAIVDAVRTAGKRLREIDREFYAARPDDICPLMDSVVPDSVRSLKPDIVIGFGYPISWIKPWFPDALVLNSETTSFSRQPFKLSFYFDHIGMFASSALFQVKSSIRKGEWTPTTASLQETDEIRSRSLRWADAAGATVFGLRKEPRQLRILLALQASGYTSFDAIVRYGNQFEYLFDIVSRVPTNIDVIATEHPTAYTARFLTDEERAELNAIFPNLKFVKSGSFIQTSQMVLPFVDGLWSVSSNLSQLAAFWGRLVGTPVQSPYAFLSDSNDIESLCDKILQRTERTDSDGAAYFAWLFRHYIVPMKYLEQPGWFAAYLKTRIALAGKPPIRAFPETGISSFREAILHTGE